MVGSVIQLYPVNHLKKDVKLMPYQVVSQIFWVRKCQMDFWRQLGRRFWWISKALFHQDVFFQCYCFNRSIWISEYCRSNPDHGWFRFHDFPCSHLNGWTLKLLGLCRAGPAGWFKQYIIFLKNLFLHIKNYVQNTHFYIINFFIRLPILVLFFCRFA